MCHVLIIEDEIVVALSIEQILMENGATSCDIAETEEEAVKSAILRRPKFISSDVRLKVGFGPHAVQQIFNLHGEIPVIFVTATPQICGAFDHPIRLMTKPVDEVQFASAFKEMTAP